MDLVPIYVSSEEVITDWSLEFDYNRKITNIWNAEILENAENHYVIKNAGHNANIQPDQMVSFGFLGEEGQPEDIPIAYKLLSFTIDDPTRDTDGDGITDLDEKECYGTDYKKCDTDSDGLSDYEELFLFRTNPLEVDSNGNGIWDADEDLDEDGIANRVEIQLGTNPTTGDTDGDGLTDYQEIYEYGCDPFVVDTDNDGLTDYEEVIMGFSPLFQDTNNDGIDDSEEKILQVKEVFFDSVEGRGINKISVEMKLNGCIKNQVSILNVYEFDSLSRDVVGLVGIPVDINSKVEFENATITFQYDESELGNVKEENLAVLWYDKKNNWYQILDQESVVDTINNTVSYETTHFSTYMLVDREGWYEAWRENIDYRISQDGDINIHSFDIAFVVDVSGSMSGTRISDAKQALKGFLDSMQDEDEAALIKFNSSATLVNNFTHNKEELSKSINSLIATGGTNVNNGLLKALDTYAGRSDERKKIIVLICDGDVNYYQSTIDRCIENNISIYAINVMSTSAHSNLQKMADQTGGEYYYSASGNELTKVLGIVEDATVGKIDSTDDDGDGLYDIYERSGMKLPNGQVVYTDATSVDTDGDGLTDFQETGIVFNVDDRYIGNFMTKEIKYFVMNSDPTQKDTDDDGITDDKDTSPWKADSISINLSSNYGRPYLNILNENGVAYDGGNQSWWTDGTEKSWTNHLVNNNAQIHYVGCGLVAMVDMEIYLAQKKGYTLMSGLDYLEYDDYGYTGVTTAPTYDAITGAIAYNDYKSYVEYNEHERYSLDGLTGYYFGLLPEKMEAGITKFMKSNNDSNFVAKFGDYIGASRESQTTSIIYNVETMLAKDIPVVFSYDNTFAKEHHRLRLYSSFEGAVNKEETNQSIASHYMTIIGMNKILNSDGTDYRYIFKVVSWGSIFYIDYDEYKQYINSFTNILKVGTY